MDLIIGQVFVIAKFFVILVKLLISPAGDKISSQVYMISDKELGLLSSILISYHGGWMIITLTSRVIKFQISSSKFKPYMAKKSKKVEFLKNKIKTNPT